MNERTPYIYLIGWPDLNKWYIGVRYARGCHPDDLWVKYFTSSNIVKDFRKKFGDPPHIEIRKIFSDRQSAQDYEFRLLTKLSKYFTKTLLNQSACGNSKFSPIKTEDHKRKIGEAHRAIGSTPAKVKASLKASNVAKATNTGKKRPDHASHMKEFWKNNPEKLVIKRGKDHSCFGRKLTEDQKEVLRNAAINAPKFSCMSCHKEKTHRGFNQHYQSCSKKNGIE